jgi:hypothetical protein
MRSTSIFTVPAVASVFAISLQKMLIFLNFELSSILYKNEGKYIIT